MRMILRMLLLNVCLLLFVGCHRHYVRPPDPLTREQIIEMSQQGTPPEEIIQKIDATGTVYDMGSKHVVELLEKGVDEKVIDHMMDTPRREAERRVYYRRPYYHYYPYPYAYGWWYYCW